MENKLIDLQAIKEAVNFYDLALYFEEESLKLSYENVQIRCPFHSEGKEKTPSCFYSLERKSAWCYGCSKKFDIFDYVLRKIGSNRFKDAIDFLIKFTGINPAEKNSLPKVKTPDYLKDIEALKRVKAEKENNFDIFKESDIKAMIDFRGDFFKDRNLTKETLDFFEVGFDQNEKRIIVPIRDIGSNLVGATGRTIYKDYKEREIPKWKHYKNSNLSNNFFNINNAISESKSKKGCIIICEGPNDVMFLHQNGYKNVIACLRNFITEAQKWILIKNFMSVYLFLDGDKGGETGRSNIYNEIKDYLDVYEVKPIDGKDPDEMTKEEIDEAFRTAQKI